MTGPVSPAPGPTLLALDFDGVVCDGRPEYFASAWRAYGKLWGVPSLPSATVQDLGVRFAVLRPLIESGWEFPLLIHALLLGRPELESADRPCWLALAQTLLAENNLTPQVLGDTVNRVRDEWFERYPEDWLRLHRFYPGIIEGLERIRDNSIEVVVVTTKAGRFARSLLASQSPRLGEIPIIGREPGQATSKQGILRHCIARRAMPDDGTGLWFIEDMLETLEHVGAALPGARLFLAGWGYNTLEQRALISLRRRTTLLSLDDFARDVRLWPT